MEREDIMLEEIKESICMKSDFLHRNYKVPMGLQKETEQFFKDLEKLGEECSDSAEFERRFEEEGYSNLFKGLYQRCIPKPEISSLPSVENQPEDNPGLLETIADDVSASEENIKEKRFFSFFRKKHNK